MHIAVPSGLLAGVIASPKSDGEIPAASLRGGGNHEKHDLPRQDYRRGKDVSAVLKSIALALVLLASGCAVRTAHVSITTDNSGKMSSVTISKTSGDPAFDTKAIGLAKRKFQKFPNPLKNHKYLQPVELMN